MNNNSPFMWSILQSKLYFKSKFCFSSKGFRKELENVAFPSFFSRHNMQIVFASKLPHSNASHFELKFEEGRLARCLGVLVRKKSECLFENCLGLVPLERNLQRVRQRLEFLFGCRRIR